MGYNERTIGGGSATGLADSFTAALKGFIDTGSFGGGTAGQQTGAANPMGDAAGIFGLMNSIINNPQADASVQEMLTRDINRGRDDIRARFGASGGMGFGTPAAVAEGMYQAESAPRIAMAMDEMATNRLGALLPIFNMAAQMAALGTPQAQTVMQPSGWMQGLNIAMDLANTAANFIPGGGASKVTDSGSNMMSAPRSVTPINPGSQLNMLDEWARTFRPLPVNPGQQYF